MRGWVENRYPTMARYRRFPGLGYSSTFPGITVMQQFTVLESRGTQQEPTGSDKPRKTVEDDDNKKV
jgi:hypothetical protein